MRIRQLDRRSVAVPESWRRSPENLSGLMFDRFEMKRISEVILERGWEGSLFYYLRYAKGGGWMVPVDLFSDSDRQVLDSLRPSWNTEPWQKP